MSPAAAIEIRLVMVIPLELRSDDVLAAVDGEVLAGDVTGALAGKEDDHRRLVGRLGETAEWNAEPPLGGVAADDRLDVTARLDADEHLCGRRTRRDRVDGDAVRSELEREAAGGLDERSLRRAVRGVVGADDMPADDRSDEHDAACHALRDEMPSAGLREKERPACVHAERAVPLLRGHLEEGSGKERAGRVDEDVEAAVGPQ